MFVCSKILSFFLFKSSSLFFLISSFSNSFISFMELVKIILLCSLLFSFFLLFTFFPSILLIILLASFFSFIFSSFSNSLISFKYCLSLGLMLLNFVLSNLMFVWNFDFCLVIILLYILVFELSLVLDVLCFPKQYSWLFDEILLSIKLKFFFDNVVSFLTNSFSFLLWLFWISFMIYINSLCYSPLYISHQQKLKIQF